MHKRSKTSEKHVILHTPLTGYATYIVPYLGNRAISDDQTTGSHWDAPTYHPALPCCVANTPRVLASYNGLATSPQILGTDPRLVTKPYKSHFQLHSSHISYYCNKIFHQFLNTFFVTSLFIAPSFDEF